MKEPIIGAERALLSQLLWQLRRKWYMKMSLEAWHKNHPDISDDIFERLYAKAKRINAECSMFNQTKGLLTIRECQQWTKPE